MRGRGIGPDTIQREGAVMIVDQSGFTRKVLERGTGHALNDVWLMRRVLIPLLREYGGEVYKVDADNLYAFFDDVVAAVNASVGAHRLLASTQRRRRDPVRASIGIGAGVLYYVSSEDDYYGREVNLAAKLGEDVAHAEQTLLTDAAYEAVRGKEVEGTPGRPRYALVSDLRIRFREWLAD